MVMINILFFCSCSCCIIRIISNTLIYQRCHITYMIVINILFFCSCSCNIVRVISNPFINQRCHIIDIIVINILFFNCCSGNIFWIISFSFINGIIIYITYNSIITNNILFLSYLCFIIISCHRFTTNWFNICNNRLFTSAHSYCLLKFHSSFTVIGHIHLLIIIRYFPMPTCIHISSNITLIFNFIRFFKFRSNSNLCSTRGSSTTCSCLQFSCLPISIFKYLAWSLFWSNNLTSCCKVAVSILNEECIRSVFKDGTNFSWFCNLLTRDNSTVIRHLWFSLNTHFIHCFRHNVI